MPKLDMLVIHPNSGDQIYQDLNTELTAIEPPLWTRLLAGYALDQGLSVQIIDAEAENLSAQAVGPRVLEADPLLVVVVVFGHQPSAPTQMMPGATRLIGALAKRANRLPTLIVGGHVSALPERSLLESGAHFACKGEGPITAVSLVAFLKDYNEPSHGVIQPDYVPGLVWRNAGNTIINEPARALEPDELHGNVWHLLPMEKYRSHNWQVFSDLGKRQPYASIYTSLNCKFNCSFCCISAPFGGSGYKTRSPVLVAEEIRHLYFRHGVRTFKLVDEMFVLNPKHVRAVCEEIINIVPDVTAELNIWAYARVDTIKPDMLALMRKAGIRWLALGIESGSKDVREQSRKGLKSASIQSIVQKIREADINVIGNYIFGLPGDTLETMQQTLDALELNCEFGNFYSAMCYPGSALYEQAVKSGAQLPESWSGYSQHSADSFPLATEALSSREILRFRDKAFQTYFTNPAYLDMIETKFGIDTRQHIENMAKQPLQRLLLRPLYQFYDRFEHIITADTPETLAEKVAQSGYPLLDSHVVCYDDDDLDLIVNRMVEAFPSNGDPDFNLRLHRRPILFKEGAGRI